MAGNLQLSLRINADGSAAITSLRQVKGEVDGLDGTARGAASGGLSALGGQLKSLALTAAAGIGIAELARAFVAANVEADRLAKGLTAVTGSSALAAQEMAYIRDTANQMGQSVTAVSDAYLGLSAATKGTALQGQATRDIFEAVSLAMGKLGKSSADTQGALLALQQMVSKATVSMEELNGQLGERLPGALKAAADGMGVTTEELVEMVSQGKVLAVDLLPALSRELRNLYDDGKAVGGLEAEWARLANAMGDLAVTTNQATGATGLLAGAIQSATALARDWEAVIRAVSNAQRGLGFAMGERDELAMLYRERTQLVNEYLGAVERANQAGDLSKTPGLAFARDEALAKLAQVERSIQAIRGGLQATAAAAKEAGDAQARSMGDDAVKLYEAQRSKVEEANQSLLKLNGTYDATAKRQIQVAEATKEYQAIAKSLGKDEAWVTEQVARYTAGLNKSTTAKGGASKASKALAKDQREEAKAFNEAERAVEGLIQRYLPARAAAEDYAQAQAAIAAALAGKAGSVKLSAAEASQVLAGMAKEQAQAADAARRESDAFYAAWADAVDSLDDTFQGLWRGLITGQGDVLGNLKETVLEWVADLSYQLLLSPLVVPIQGVLMGIMGGGAAGVTGTATSVLGGASSLSSVFSGFSSLASGITNVFSGAALTGIMDGFGAASSIISAQGYFGGFGANMALASGAASTGSTSFAIGAAVPYLLPAAAIAAIGVAVFNKWQSDQEPRYGTLAAMTGGSAAGLEDSEWGAASGAYVQGSFGLSFGLTDKGSKNMEAPELREIYQALADVSDTLADFFGEELSSFIEAELQKMSDFGDGLIHLTEDEGDLGGAMAALVERIAQAAGRSADDIGIAFGAMVGDLSGTAEEVGKQIQAAMVASTMAVELSDRFAEPLGQMLALTGDITTDVGLLTGYIDVFGASGESSAETLARLTAQLGLLDAAAKQTATNLEGLSASALLTLSDDLIAAFGGIEAASQAQAFYYQEFTTGTEKLVDAIQAAADQIDREIPKLQDELMQLSEDVATAVTALADDLAGTGDQIASGLANVAPPDLTPLYQTIDEGLSGSGQWEEINAKLLEQQAENWAKSIADWDTLFGVDPPFLLEVTRGLEQYGSTLEQFGYVVDEGAQAFLDSLRQAQQAAADVAANSDVPTETITTPGDPNAAILAQLLNDLPKTREGFEDLIGAIDLTTEAGQKLYAGLLELAPQFDLLYDGAEAFSDWLLGVDDVGTALRELERVFSDWGLALPENRDDLLALYESGTLTTEQMAILGAYLAELGLVFGDLSEDANDLSSELNEAMAALRRAVAAEKDALAETHEARMKALNAELEAANEALGDAQSLLNTVQGALNTLESAQGVSANEVNAALAQLSAWATSGVTPDQEALSDTLATLSAANANDYATAADYQAVQDQQYAALLALEHQGLATVDTAQATVDALEAQLEQETAWYEAEIERLDAMLASAEDQVALAEGTYEALLSVDAALAQLNALLAGAGVDPVAGDTGTAGGTSDTPGGAPGSGSQEQTASLEAIRAEIAALRADLAAIGSASQARLINLDDTVTKWDKDGLPAGDGEEIVLLRAA